MRVNDIKNVLMNEQFAVYGNGYIAKRFYKQLVKIGASNNLAAVAVTEKTEGITGINNKPVTKISDINRDMRIILATHDAVADEMKAVLEKLHFKSYIWIYPYLFDMELGEPIERNRSIALSDLLKINLKVYHLVIYYLSLKDYCNENKYNGELYKKLMIHHSSVETANRRWENFRKKINKCMTNGFTQDYNVKVLENYNLLDGFHRFAMALYFGGYVINADVYKGDKEFFTKDAPGGDVLIGENELTAYYAPNEVEDIKRATEELRGMSMRENAYSK